MKVLLLADSNSVHTMKWATSLADRGFEICIVGLECCTVDTYKNYDTIRIVSVNKKVSRHEGSFTKIRYLGALPVIRKVIKSFKPDLLHAHYASSYGLLGALAGFSPFIISVWGSDVFSFPNKSLFHRKILLYNLKKADTILSTSHVMAKETERYTTKKVEVTPFGIDLNFFKKKHVPGIFGRDDIVVGTVKTLDYRYGQEYLIKAFRILVDKFPRLPLKLLIVGGGRLFDHLKELVVQLGLENRTEFTGSVPYSDVPKYHNMIDITVFLSNSESFGVSVIEASACENPVVVSEIGGLPEVVENGITGFIVPPRNPERAAEAIKKLILDGDLRKRMGKAGRERVRELFTWEDNVEKMIRIYKKSVTTQ